MRPASWFLPLVALACHSAPDPEANAKPGINDRFLSPDLDVGHFVQVFEGESRDIYRMRAQIAQAVGLEEGMTVADIGAGTGLFLELFAKAVGPQGRVYEVDLSPRFVSHLRGRAKEQGLGQVEVVQCTERSVELAPHSVDIMFLCDVYHHFEFPRSTMTSIHRALRPGGTLVLVDFERIPGKSRSWLLGHVRAGKAAFRREIEGDGFRLLEEVKVPGLQENYLLRFQKT